MKKFPMRYALQRFEDAVQHLATDPRPLPERLAAAVPDVVGLSTAELGSQDMQETYHQLIQAMTSEARARLNAEEASRLTLLIVDYRDRLRAGVGGSP